MQLKKGIAVSPGIAIAKAFIIDATEYSIHVKHINPDEISEEVNKLEKALSGIAKGAPTVRVFEVYEPKE